MKKMFQVIMAEERFVLGIQGSFAEKEELSVEIGKVSPAAWTESVTFQI